MENRKVEEKDIVISYITTRQAIGWMGILFPFVLLFGNYLISWLTGYETGCNPFKNSISLFYYTRMGDVFVGTLCAVGLFLVSYKGYETKDNVVSTLAGIFAFGIALLPCTSDVSIPCNMRAYISIQLIGTLHLTMAALFFTTLAYMSYFIFTMSAGEQTKNKAARNTIYKTCAWVMVGCLIGIVIYMVWLKKSFPVLENYHIVYWLETIALLAFGVSWLTKGEILLKDK